MNTQVYFDTELYYRNPNNLTLQEEIKFIIPSHNYNKHIIGFTYLSQYNKEISNIYQQWEETYFLLKNLQEKYNLDFLELKLFKIGYIGQRVSIYIDGSEQLINNIDLSDIESNFNEQDIFLLSTSLSKIYNEMKTINDKFPSLIIGQNDGKHNNCIIF